MLIQVDTGDSRVRPLNDKMLAYVAGSRGRNDLQLYTDNKTDLESTLNRAAFKPTALSIKQFRPGQTRQQPTKHQEQTAEASMGVGVA